jgi:hopene-associated glycosyltransferase HpnB
MLSTAIAGISLLLWAYLIGARGRFWMCSVRDDSAPPAPPRWPSVAVVIPARNEAKFIGSSVGSLLRQNYQGQLSIIVVDDDSSDGTAAAARALTPASAADRQLKVVTNFGLPAGWTGKLWALKQGIAAAEAQEFAPEFVLLTDADIAHAPDTLAWLVAHSLAGGYALTSLMAKLRCTSLAERSHVPAFVFFFQMLYPFRWVRQTDAATAAAAGGCMLIRLDALREAGGIESIRNALIDDCALARRLKARGPIWLGLTERISSLRPYEGLAEIKQMISRSAYAQLGYSPLLLAATTVGMALVYLAPPLCAIFATGLARWLGLAAWLAMAAAFQPTLRLYRLSPLWGAALPGIALLYMYYTLDSAYQYARGRGGQWKGRIHVNAPRLE